ncbi:MAG TPA: DUF1800 family protein [Aquabacterium sp.]|nr:DUF1800 family protein [Aquabacterium sp.]
MTSRSTFHRATLAQASAIGLCLALTACGGGGGGGDSPTASNAGTSATASPADGPASAASAVSANATANATINATADTPTAPDPTATVATVLAVADASVKAEAMALSAQSSLQAEAQAATQAERAQATTAPAPAPAPAPAVASAPPAPNTSPAPAAPAEPAAPNALIVRARGTLAGGVAPQMLVRVNGQPLGTATVASTQLADYSFALPSLPAGTVVDVVFTNDAMVNGEDRNLIVSTLRHGSQVVMPVPGNALIDRGAGAAAFDGADTLPGGGGIAWNAALRLTWPAAPAAVTAALARQRSAVRFLLQASFGPTPADVQALTAKTDAIWLAEQMALPHQNDYLNAVQAQYDQGDAWRPKGAQYSPAVVAQTFWKTAVTAPDQLRKRVAFALHQGFMVSQMDSSLWHQARAVAAYHDLLNRHAFGSFRQLMEDMALSPAMGIYLSHIRNRKEDAATGRVPDENFARELMQLFTIGLHELNLDGSLKRDAQGRPVETYGNDDVMALAKVFTGWSWAFADAELTDAKFRWGNPDTSAAGDQRIDMLPMKPYPGQHSTAAKALFTGKPWALSIPANGSARSDLKLALDALFNHPNVGPFVGRQLIQRLVTSQPSPAYVARVAGAFNNNGQGQRGDLAAVVRAILLDDEARGAPPASFGKLREPVLRVAHWARALGARSNSGQWALAWELEAAGQRALAAPSVFGHFRPGYVPPNTSFATSGSTAPEFQIVNESSVAAWINTAERMAGGGLGWTGSAADVAVDHVALGALAASGQPGLLVDHLDLLLLGGRMRPALRQALIDTIAGISDSSTNAAANRARAASFLVLASPDYLAQP